MSDPDLTRLREEILNLPEAYRAQLIQQLIATLPVSQEPEIGISKFRRRMRKYVDDAWALASNSLSVHRIT